MPRLSHYGLLGQSKRLVAITELCEDRISFGYAWGHDVIAVGN